jgi:alpha-amylase
MQESALSELFALAGKVKNTGCPEILDSWRKLQCSDHFYYMCTKYFADGDVHKYFNPYESPYDCYIIFMNVLDHLNKQCDAVLAEQVLRQPEAAIV